MVVVAMIMLVLEVLAIHSTRYGFYRISPLDFQKISAFLDSDFWQFQVCIFFSRLTSPGSQPGRK